MDHATGWNCVSTVAKSMGNQLKKTHLLIADKFRHRASTLYALMDLPEHEREKWYRHMGHSASINRDVYQCPLAVGEITHVGGFLQKLDMNGKKATLQAGQAPSARHADNSSVRSTGFEPATTQIPDTLCSILPSSESPEQASRSEQPSSESPEQASSSEQPSSERPKQTKPQPPNSTSSQPRRYSRWSNDDSSKITSFFKHYINRPGQGSTGSLPPVLLVKQFLHQNKIFDDANLSIKEKISLVKTKVFNERKKLRSKANFEEY